VADPKRKAVRKTIEMWGVWTYYGPLYVFAKKKCDARFVAVMRGFQPGMKGRYGCQLVKFTARAHTVSKLLSRPVAPKKRSKKR